MNNNKNLMKTEDKSNSELRRMFPKDGSDIGVINGKKIEMEEVHDKHVKQEGQALKNTVTKM